jgi:hypothetical protein
LLDAVANSNPDETNNILTTLADIEALLAQEPDTAGESREPGTRFVYRRPLAITFKVNARLQEVLVIGARVIRRTT